MFNLQGSEIIVLLLIALVVVGPEKLPDAVKRFTRTYNELKKMGSGFQSEFKSALDEPMKQMKETASLIQDSANPDQFVAENQSDVARMEPAPIESPEIAGADDVAEVADVAGADDVAEVAGADEAEPGPEASKTADVAPFSSVAAANSSAAIASRIQAASANDAENDAGKDVLDDAADGAGNDVLDDAANGAGNDVLNDAANDAPVEGAENDSTNDDTPDEADVSAEVGVNSAGVTDEAART